MKGESSIRRDVRRVAPTTRGAYSVCTCVGQHSNICLEIVKIENGRVRNRTGDLSHAKGARYQLRHTPKPIRPTDRDSPYNDYKLPILGLRSGEHIHTIRPM